jgi:hypothetical protein
MLDGVSEKKTESERRRQARVVRELLGKIEEKLGQDAPKATLGDYIRLVQLRKELEADEAKEIRVTWVDPEKKTPESETGE